MWFDKDGGLKKELDVVSGARSSGDLKGQVRNLVGEVVLGAPADRAVDSDSMEEDAQVELVFGWRKMKWARLRG